VEGVDRIFEATGDFLSAVLRIVIAAKQPAGVPEDNWLPINREDLDLDIMMRIYAPDLARFATWTPPVARRID
jgi:hypothetical protein